MEPLATPPHTSAAPKPAPSTGVRVAVVAIEVDGRMAFLTETDKWQEMLGASFLIYQLSVQAREATKQQENVRALSFVSGDVRLWAPIEHAAELLGLAWELREWLEDHGVPHSLGYVEADETQLTDLHPPGAVLPSLQDLHRRLSEQTRSIKDAKPGADARPTCALFAPCNIHPNDDVNHHLAIREDEPRRTFVGRRAHKKRRAWRSARGDFLERHMLSPLIARIESLVGRSLTEDEQIRIKKPEKFSWLKERHSSDQFAALIAADGDELARFVTAIPYNSEGWRDPRAPWERNAALTSEIDEILHAAFAKALVDVLVPDLATAERIVRDTHTVLPVLIQVMAGDDYWILTSRKTALPLACGIARAAAKLLTDSALIQDARQVLESGAVPGPDEDLPHPTVSMGVAFAKVGYPAHAWIAAAQSLLGSAKRLRKGRVWGRRDDARDDEGQPMACIDWQWIASSRSESVADARALSTCVRDPVSEDVLLLTSRPWTVAQTERFVEEARRWAGNDPSCPGIARNKRKRLDELLRFGRSVGRALWDGWCVSLSEAREEPKTLSAVLSGLRQSFFPRKTPPSDVLDPWWPLGSRDSELGPDAVDIYVTPLLDLLELDDVLAEPKPEDTTAAGGDEPAPRKIDATV